MIRILVSQLRKRRIERNVELFVTFNKNYPYEKFIEKICILNGSMIDQIKLLFHKYPYTFISKY